MNLGLAGPAPEHEPIVHDSWHALRETREEAKANKERLVFHCAEDATGTPLTIERLVALAQEQPWFRKGGKGTLLNDTSWYNDEPFYKQETAPTGWRLVSAEPLEASFNQNYAEQTFTLYEQLKARSLVDPTTLTSYEAELNAWLADHALGTLASVDSAALKTYLSADATWKQAADELAGLMINQRHRTRTVQDLAEGILLLAGEPERRLYDGTWKYNWNVTRASGGSLVYVGSFGAGGADVSRYGPGYAYPFLGVRLSRTSPSS